LPIIAGLTWNMDKLMLLWNAIIPRRMTKSFWDKKDENLF
jgi:hypothetical protein